MRRLLAAVSSTAFIAAFAAVGLAPSAHATAPAEYTSLTTQTLTAPGANEPSPISWAVQPGDANGPNGRSWVELSADGGTSHTDHLVVRNLGRQDATFNLKAADGYFTEKGRFNMLASDQKSVDAGTWITVPEKVTVPAGQQKVVPFEVTVPAQATPGDHAAGIAATVSSTGTDGAGNKMGVESRVGFRVMVQVKGELAPAFQATATVNHLGNPNPFAPGTASVDVNVQNTGNTRLAAGGTVAISGVLGLGRTEVALPALEDVLPGTTRAIHVDVPNVWPLFIAAADVNVKASAVEGQTMANPPQPVSASASAIALPWSQLLILAAIILVVVAVVVARQRRRRKLDLLMHKAREEGRREAMGTSMRPRANALGLVGALLATSWLMLPAEASPDGPGGIHIGVEITPLNGPSETSTPTQTVSPTETGTPTQTSSPTGSATPTEPTGTPSQTSASPSGTASATQPGSPTSSTTAVATATSTTPGVTLPETGAGFLPWLAIGGSLVVLAAALLILNRQRGRRAS